MIVYIDKLKEVQDKYLMLVNYLIKKNLTITTMESCTAGFISSCITDVDNSSKIIKGAFVTYSNDAKIIQGVDRNVIEKYGVYSKETAIEMARVCKDKYETNIGIGITGTLGIIDENNVDSKKGEVYFAIDMDGKIYDYHIVVNDISMKFEGKVIVADNICDELLKLLSIGKGKYGKY